MPHADPMPGERAEETTKHVSMVFCGDFAPCFGYEAPILRGEPVLKELQSLLARSAYSFANVESVLCEPGRPIAKVGPHLRAAPRTIEALASAGFRIAGLANNHSMDFGGAGLDETIAACSKAGLQTCGAGPNREAAERVLRLEAGGITIALIAVAEEEFNRADVNSPGTAIADPINILRQINKVRQCVDFVVVTLHGGNELFPFPRPGLRRLCHFLIESGSDAVVCHHNHIPSAFEHYLDKPIVYGVGNLLFDNLHAFPEWELGYAAQLGFETDRARRSVSLGVTAFHQSVEAGGLRLLEGSQEASFRDVLDARNAVLADHKKYDEVWRQFCDSKLVETYTNQFVPFRFRGMQRLSAMLPFYRWFNPTSMRLRRLNSIRCESHREVLLSLLERS